MINTDISFYGQQEDEKILYSTKPHPLAEIFNLVKVVTISLVVFIVFYYLGRSITEASIIFDILAVILPVTILVLGTKVVSNFQERNISYITDRRIVRFVPTTFFATNIRSLSWEEAVKVKTFAPNVLFKQLKIGTVVIHARTTIRTSDENESVTSADDIEINDVYLYRDLGNYIDKILFTYKQMPKNIKDIHPFVAKPKGKRY